MAWDGRGTHGVTAQHLCVYAGGQHTGAESGPNQDSTLWVAVAVSAMSGTPGKCSAATTPSSL